MEYQPAWLTNELNDLLAKIGGRYARKKRNTILRLAEGAAMDRTILETLALPDTCNRDTWYGQRRRDPEDPERWIQKPGWRHDPDIQDALDAATRRAQWWVDQAQARRTAKRLEDVARARDKLADLAFPAAMALGALLGSEADETRRKAANDILDRADEATATKATTYGEQREAIEVQVILPDNQRDDRDPQDPTAAGAAD